MRVTFIQPPSVYLLDSKAMPPLGILYLSAWLRKHGHEVSIIDLAGVRDWRAEISREQSKLDSADWVGLTCTTPQYYDSIKIRDNIRARGYDMPVAVGGIHLTSLAHNNEMNFLDDGFDAYCVGEGYNSVTKMCADLKNGGLNKLYAEPILKDVNDLPFAARDLIDIRGYRYKLGDTPTTSHYSQYGCVYGCTYCESPLSGSFTVRAMSAERIVAEVRQVRDEFGIYGATFFDDEMNLSKSRMLAICDGFRRLGDVVWRGFMVTGKWDAELARACKSSGCYEVATGIESGSPTILRNIRKPATVELNRRFVVSAKRAGLRVKCFMIVGLPSESWQTIAETDRFLESLKAEGCAPDDVDFSILQIYAGSPLYREPKDVEFTKDWENAYYKSSPGSYEDLIQVRTAAMTKKDLVAARNYLESKWKPEGWVKDNIDRKDLDRVMASIEYAKSRITKDRL